MAYITPAQLAVWPGAKEMAEACTPDHQPVVTAALFDAVLRGASTAAWPAQDVAIATQALAAVQSAIDAAHAEIDSYLSLRYALPLSPVPGALTEWARKIARYRMHKDLRVTTPGSDAGQHPIHADYQTVVELLEKVSKGTLSLGVADPDPPSGAAYFGGEQRHFARSQRGLPT